MNEIILEKKKRSGNTTGIRVSSEFANYLADLSDETGYTVIELSSIFVPYLKKAVTVKDPDSKKGDNLNAPKT
jgi:hypothetical protein